jgi:hypothetical protein
MRKLLLLLTTIISLSAKAQTSVYHPFPTTNAGWVYQYYDDFHMPTSYFGSYAITGDTVFSGTNYKRIAGCSAWGFCGIGGIRDSNKVIYFRPDTAITEYVLYDFNLNLGDTMIHPFGGTPTGIDTVTIMNVDSVLASDGYHRRLWLSTFDMWIEGIGSMTYLFVPAGNMGVSGNDVLICMTTDSGFAYPPGIGSCIVSVPEQSQTKNKITISPNPMTDELNVEVNNKEFSEFILYDIASRKLLQQKFTNSVTLNTEQLAKGIYIYEVQSKNGSYKKGKIVKD